MHSMTRRKSVRCLLFVLLALILTGGMPYKKLTVKAATRYSVRFFDQDLKHEYKSIAKYVTSGGNIVLPTVKDKKGYTFLGWSATKGKSTRPEYQAGRTVSVKCNKNLFAVWFKRSSEKNITAAELARLDRKKYTRAILIGDSRGVNLEKTLNKEFGSSSHAGVSFISGWGQGLSWFKRTGVQMLLRNLKNYGGGTKEKPVAIAINLGVNDSQNISGYISYMKTLASQLKGYHCKFFYVSVNPLNSAVLASRGRYGRTEPKVIKFNSRIRTGLSGIYQYIDTYTKLLYYGYAFDSGEGRDTGYDDGVHYSTRTYKKIYNMTIYGINAAK